MSGPSAQPTVIGLGQDFDLLSAARSLATWPGLLWLDSSVAGPTDRSGDALGRHSFLTADPIEVISARRGDADPWAALDSAVAALPITTDASLPRFVGGWAGLLGYESATWLEEIPVAERSSLADVDFHFGLYDWTIAVDHQTGGADLIVQPWGNGSVRERSKAILERINAAPREDASGKVAGTRESSHSRSGTSPVSCPFPPPGFVATDRPAVASDVTGAGFRGSVKQIVEGIRNGDCFQVNLSQTLSLVDGREPLEIYERLRDSNPAPFAGYYDAKTFQVLSSSPEGFLRVRGREVVTRPIKGTVRRTGRPETDQDLAEQLLASDKDRAENVMIVDLMRNDLSRVCSDDSVRVEALCQIEQYQYVQHLVSVVSGQLRDDQSTVDLLRALFPGGSVTGAPKIEAMQTIARLEKHGRGPYCGSLGYISGSGDADFNILIRTITHRQGKWAIPVGGGITARSLPEAEEVETWVKAEGMLRAFE